MSDKYSTHRVILANRLGSSVVAEGDRDFCEGIANRLNEIDGNDAQVEAFRPDYPIARARQALRNAMACSIATDEAKELRVDALDDLLAGFIDSHDARVSRIATLLLWAFDRGYDEGGHAMREFMRS